MVFDDTQVVQGFTCVWKIESFTLPKINQKFLLKSQIFKVNYLENTEWHLEIHQNGDEILDICLCLDEGLMRTSVSFSLFLMTRSGWHTIVKRISEEFIKGKCSKPIAEMKWGNTTTDKCTFIVSLVLHKNKKKALCSQCFLKTQMTDEDFVHFPVQEYSFLKPSDFINFPHLATFSCAVSGVTDSSTQTRVQQNEPDNFEDLFRFFEEKKFQFVTLRTAEKEFSVHKALLCAKSPVFNAMFEKEMRESGSHLVEIEDIDASTLSLFLNFLHLEPLRDLEWDEAIKLYYAADKYQVLRLRDICVSFLKKNLSNTNVCEAIVLADIHGDKELKYSAQKYFCKNSKDILRLPEWKDFMMKSPELTLDTLHILADEL